VKPGIAFPIDSMNAHRWWQATAYSTVIGAFAVLLGIAQCGFAVDWVDWLELWMYGKLGE
jgi:hypothetical protein